MTPQEKHDKFVEAAKRVFSRKDNFSCNAVSMVFNGDRIPSEWSNKYRDAFVPKNKSFLVEVCRGADHDDRKERELRVMLLLFAAQMARTGDL